MSQEHDKLFQALKILLSKLQGIDFVLIGSFNLFLQGIAVTPRDIDLLTDDQGVKKISQIFGSKITLEEEDRYKETQFEINQAEVQAVSNRNNFLRPANFKEQIVWLEKEGCRIPCLSIESEMAFYQRANRVKDQEKIRLIQVFLQETGQRVEFADRDLNLKPKRPLRRKDLFLN